MSLRLRSSSVGAAPRPNKHTTSRAESAAAVALDVRCACQFFQTTSLLPERVNPVGSRPPSSLGNYSTHSAFAQYKPGGPPGHPCPHYGDPISNISEADFSFGVVGQTDYYAESVTSRPSSPSWIEEPKEFFDFRDQPAEMAHENNQNISNVVDFQSLDEAMGQAFIKQKELNSSILLARRRSASQHSTERTIRQRDPSQSSILRMRLSQSNLRDPPGHRDVIQSRGHSPMPGSSVADEPRIIRQRDPSQSSLMRRKMMSLPPQQSLELDMAPKAMGLTIAPGSTAMYFANQPSPSRMTSQSPILGARTLTEPVQMRGATERKSRLDEPLSRNALLTRPTPNYPVALAQPQHNPVAVAQPQYNPVAVAQPQHHPVALTQPQQNPIMALSLVPSRSSRYSRGSNENLPVTFASSDKSLDRISPLPIRKPSPKRTKSPKKTVEKVEKKSLDSKDVWKNLQLPLQLIVPNMQIDETKAPEIKEIKEIKKVKESKPAKVEMQAMPVSIMKATKVSMGSVSTSGKKQESSMAVFEEVNLSECIQSRVFENYDFSAKNPPAVAAPPPATAPGIGEKSASRDPSRERKLRQRDPSESSILRTRLTASVQRDPVASRDVIDHRDSVQFENNPIYTSPPLHLDRAEETWPPVQPAIIKQRDPSTSSFTRNRYQPSPAPQVAAFDIKATDFNAPSDLQLDFTERRASEISTLIKQKDLQSSTLINRRRRNLSEARDDISPAGKISKTVSFEFDKKLMAGPYDDAQRESSPFRRDSSPFRRDPSSILRDTSPPVQRESSPTRQDTTLFQRELSPLKLDTLPIPRDPSPFKRDSSPFQRDSSPYREDNSPFQRKKSSFRRDSSPFLRLESSPFRRGSTAFRRDSVYQKLETTQYHKDDSSPSPHLLSPNPITSWTHSTTRKR